MKKIIAILSFLVAGAAFATDSTIVSLDLQGVYSGYVGSQSSNGMDDVFKKGYNLNTASVNGEGDCLNCADFTVLVNQAAGEYGANTGTSESDVSDVQTSTVGEASLAAGTAMRIGDFSRAAMGTIDYLNSTAGKFVGDSGLVQSTQTGSGGIDTTSTFTGTACPSGGCDGGGTVHTTLSGVANTYSTTVVTAHGANGNGALATNAGLQAIKIELANGQLNISNE